MIRKQFPGLLERKSKRKQKSNQNQKIRNQRKQQRNNQKKSSTASRPKEGKKPECKKKKFIIEEKFSIKRNISTMSSERIDVYQNYGSGWDFYRVEKIFIEVTQFSPPTGASHIPLPKDLTMKKGVVNPANDDDKCF
jgi:hypothetical protein